MGNRWSSGRLSSRVVPTKPFSFSLWKQAKHELMSVGSLSKYNYSRRVHLIFLSYHLWSCEKSPGLCPFHRAPVDVPGHFLHALIFKFIQFPQFMQFFLEGHLEERTFFTLPHPQSTVCSQLLYTGFHKFPLLLCRMSENKTHMHRLKQL